MYVESFEHTATEHPDRLFYIVEQLKMGMQIEFMGDNVDSWLEIVKFETEELPSVTSCLIVPKKLTPASD